MSIEQAKEILQKIQNGTANAHERALAKQAFDLVLKSAIIKPN